MTNPDEAIARLQSENDALREALTLLAAQARDLWFQARAALATARNNNHGGAQ